MNAQEQRTAEAELTPAPSERQAWTWDGHLVTLSPQTYAALERVSLAIARAELALLEAREAREARERVSLEGAGAEGETQ